MFSIELYSGYISLVIFLVTLVLLIVWGTRRPEGLPPGPTPLPIVGNIPSVLKSDTRRAFAELRDQYGDVFSLVIGNAVLVVVNGLETMKEMFIKNGNIFSERPTNLGYSSLTKGLGVINSNGQKWKEQRRFALTTLRDFGMGRAEMEERIAVECQVCLNIIEEHNGTPFDPSRLLMCCVSNVISSVLFGKSFPHDDKDFVFHLDAVESSAKILGNASFAHFFPIYKYFILRSLTKTDNYVRHGIIGRELKEHLESYDENNLRDFIDAYIKECKQFEKDGIQNSFHYDNLLQIISEFFFAGTETTTSTLRWALIYLSLYPEHQRAVQKEIDSVIGTHRKPTVTDRKYLPFTEATVLEIQRLADVVPFSVPHGVAEEATFRGYRIPANSIILPNLSSVLNSKELWGDPEVFRPGRFLDEDTRELKRDANLPFSLGKRMCLGESLARMELFIFITTMVQSFTFTLPDTQPTPCLQGILGITRMPHHYKIIATKRW